MAAEFFNENALFTGGLFPEWFSAEWESNMESKFTAKVRR
jgi:hypothetical protein